MNLYIDKANLASLIQSRADSMYDDCVKLLKKQLNVYFNFAKDDLKDSEKLMAWFTSSFIQGVSADITINWDSNFPSRPLKSNSANNFDSSQLSSVYLLEDEDIHKLRDIGGLLIGGVGEEIFTLHRLFFLQNDYLFEKELRIGDHEFQKWEDLESYSPPLTDIIIIDPFILKNNEVEDSTVDVNLIKLLGVYCSKTFVKVNIVITYNPSQADYDADDIKNRIVAHLESILNKKPYVTFVKTVKEHDRTIITNYTRMTGNTFTYWNENGVKITKGKEITIKSLAKSENHRNSNAAIADLQSIIDHAIKNDGVIGDKRSGYLSFA